METNSPLSQLLNQELCCGVLMGGPSSERDISLKSGRAVFEALSKRGVRVVPLDIAIDDTLKVKDFLQKSKIDVAFIALHGRFGEDGTIQDLLDDIRIPYTCSGPQASRLGMDKAASRRIFQDSGIAVPRYFVLEDGALPRMELLDLVYPLVVKPASQGSSIGVTFVQKDRDLHPAVISAYRHDRKIIIEEFINGREITVGVLGNRALPVVEIRSKRSFFDYQAKYEPGFTEYLVPAPLSEEIAGRAQEIALRCYKALGCRGCARVDMILPEELPPVVLEINTIPGLTSTSLLPKAAQAEGLDFSQLCLYLLQEALEGEGSRE